MALNATVGSDTANSYVTLVEANLYFEDRIHSELWSEFTKKEALLITSSRLLDWYVKWKGYRSSSTQSMQWPRTGVLRRDGSSVDTNIIPDEVKIAVYELSLSSITIDRTSDNPLAGIEEVRVSSLMIKADNGDSDSTAADVIPEKVWKIISDLYSIGGGCVVRLMRA